MFEGRTKLAYVAVALIIVGIGTMGLAIIPFNIAKTEYPTTTPTMPTVPTLPLVLKTNSSSVENFVIVRPNTLVFGYMPPNTITYRVSGSSITSEIPLNITVTMNIDPLYPTLGYFIDPEGVVIDNSQYLLIVGPNKTVVPTGWFDHLLEFQLISNSSRFGLVYSTSYRPFNNTFFPEIGNTISLNNGGLLTGTLYLLIGSKANPTSTAWFQGFTLNVRNVTTISVESYQDLQLEKETNFLENANLQNNAQIQYAEAETEYNNGVVTALTWVIIAFVVVDVGVSFIDIGVSLYDTSEKKNENRKCDAEGVESHTDDKDK